MFVTQLAYARNLESLYLDIGQALHEDNNWRFEPLFNLFCRSLAKCNRLKDLIVCVREEYCTYLMRELVVALTPTFTE